MSGLPRPDRGSSPLGKARAQPPRNRDPVGRGPGARSSCTTRTISVQCMGLGGWRGGGHGRRGAVGSQKGSERLQRDAGGGRGRSAGLGTLGPARLAPPRRRTRLPPGRARGGSGPAQIEGHRTAAKARAALRGPAPAQVPAPREDQAGAAALTAKPPDQRCRSAGPKTRLRTCTSEAEARWRPGRDRRCAPARAAAMETGLCVAEEGPERGSSGPAPDGDRGAGTGEGEGRWRRGEVERRGGGPALHAPAPPTATVGPPPRWGGSARFRPRFTQAASAPRPGHHPWSAPGHREAQAWALHSAHGEGTPPSWLILRQVGHRHPNSGTGNRLATPLPFPGGGGCWALTPSLEPHTPTS